MVGKEFYIGNITYADSPCWYELSWQTKIPAILLRIHNDFINNNYVMTDESPIVRILTEKLGLKNFKGDFRDNIGFEDALVNQGEKDGFTEFALKIPQIKKESDGICLSCKGSGKAKWLNEACFNCLGTGKDHVIDSHEALTASASLTVLTTLLKFPDRKTSAKKQQLLTIETITEQRLHGGALGGEISHPLRRWLKNYVGDDPIPEVPKAMINAYDWMFGAHKDLYRSFRISIREDGGLIMNCLGDACSMYPDFNSRNEECGYDMNCHNVDTPWQQLTLIAGLAAIHDKARAEIKEY